MTMFSERKMRIPSGQFFLDALGFPGQIPLHRNSLFAYENQRAFQMCSFRSLSFTATTYCGRGGGERTARRHGIGHGRRSEKDRNRLAQDAKQLENRGKRPVSGRGSARFRNSFGYMCWGKEEAVGARMENLKRSGKIRPIKIQRLAGHDIPPHLPKQIQNLLPDPVRLRGGPVPRAGRVDLEGLRNDGGFFG